LTTKLDLMKLFNIFLILVRFGQLPDYNGFIIYLALVLIFRPYGRF